MHDTSDWKRVNISMQTLPFNEGQLLRTVLQSNWDFLVQHP